MKAIWWWLYLFNIYISRTWNAGLLCYRELHKKLLHLAENISYTCVFQTFPQWEKTRLATDQVYKITAISNNAIHRCCLFNYTLDFRRPP